MTKNLCTEDANSTSLAACSQALREECAYIAAHPNIMPDCIELFEIGDFELVKFLMRYGECNSPVEKRFVNPEPFVFRYKKDKAGHKAPSIFSERKDFPRNVPHLNPVEDNSPSSICLDRSGKQSLYDAQGITGTITRLASWLEDTEAGCSQHDGWEPTPRGMGISSVSLNIGALQRYVSGRTKIPRIAYGKCGLLYDNQTQNTHDFTYFLSESAIKNLDFDRRKFSLAKNYYLPFKDIHCVSDIPIVCIWASDDSIISYHQPTLIDSSDTLKHYAKEIGVDEQLAFFEKSILANAKTVANTKPFMLLMLAQRRPMPLIPDIPSDAVGDDRAIELIPLAIRLSLKPSPVIEAIHQCDTIAETTNSLLTHMSGGTEEPGDSTIVGCGSVGSAVTSQLGKLGAKHITLIDNDTFLPHNVSRHILGKDAIGYKKASYMKHVLERQLPISIAAKKKRFQELSDSEIKRIKNQGLLIDCTAELSITQLAYNNSKFPKILKVELAHDGRLGILALEGEEHNPCIQDLKACLYKSAINNPHIEQWLSSNKQHSSVATGQTCASATMTMPNYAVTSHVSSFMPKIHNVTTKTNETPGLGINVLDEDRFPVGWNWLDVPAFQIFVSDSENGKWDVRVHPNILLELNEVSSQHIPNEAGGFLYGTYDRVNRSICIVHQIAPKTAKHEATSITLPAAGETDEEKDWLQKTVGLLPLVGTWHSHVGQSCRPSRKDEQRITDAAAANVVTPTPFIALIVGNDGASVNVVLPNNW